MMWGKQLLRNWMPHVPTKTELIKQTFTPNISHSEGFEQRQHKGTPLEQAKIKLEKVEHSGKERTETQRDRPLSTKEALTQPLTNNKSLISQRTTRCAPNPTSEPFVQQDSELVGTRKEPKLCSEQIALVDLILSGQNVFFTGSAGSGKSTALKAAIRQLRSLGKCVNIIAPTGRAALNINGQTLWSYAAWTPNSMRKPLGQLIFEARKKVVKKRLSQTDVLVVDEISMVENHHFQRLNGAMQGARDSFKPFGGIQLIITGDFCQLPPVKPFQFCIKCGKELIQSYDGKTYKCKTHGEWNNADKWAFCSKIWEKCQFKYVNLSTIHRQKDVVFINILEKCRKGNPFSEEDKKILLNHECDVKDGVRLFSTREEARRINQAEFARLPAVKREFECFDDIQLNPDHEYLAYKTTRQYPDGPLLCLQDHQLEAYLELKTDMLVTLLVNLDIDSGLVNGSQGRIIGWEELPYAWATFTTLRDIDLGISSLQRRLIEFRAQNIHKFLSGIARPAWPIVRFSNGLTRTITATCSVSEHGDSKPYTLISRTQIPLCAAWATSIHKSQGMTLDRVIVDLSRNFDDRQTYVALSRARDLRGLKVEGLGKWIGNKDETVEVFLRDKLGINS